MHEVLSAALGWMREVLSTESAGGAVGRGWGQGPSGASLSAAGPCTRQHHPLAATSTCCTGATAEPSPCHGHAIAVPLPLGSVQPGLHCSLCSLARKQGRRKGHPGGTGVPGERQMVCFPSAGTWPLLWCNAMAESTAPACSIIPWCPDGTGFSTPAEDAALGTGCRTSIVGAERDGRDGAWVEASVAQVMEHRDTWLRTSTKKREIPVTKASTATLWEDRGPDRVSRSGIHQCPTKQDNPSRDYGIFHCKCHPETSL